MKNHEFIICAHGEGLKYSSSQKNSHGWWEKEEHI